VVELVLTSYILFLTLNKSGAEYLSSSSVTIEENTDCVFIGFKRYCATKVTVCDLRESTIVVIWNIVYYCISGLSVFIFIILFGKVYSKLGAASRERENYLKNDRVNI